MIPEKNIPEGLTFSLAEEPSKTYRLSEDKIQGYVTEVDALKQAVFKVLNTEKYEYPIYSFNYGIELESLIGRDPTYVKIELMRRIRECLLEDGSSQSQVMKLTVHLRLTVFMEKCSSQRR